MKKKRIYIIAPILMLVLFGGYYWNFRSQYEAHQAEIVAAQKAKKAEKLRQDEAARDIAMADALAAQKQRKAERAAREALDEKMRNDKENAVLDSEKAAQESQKLERQADKLTKDVADNEKDIAALQEDDTKQVAQIAFLGDYVKKAQENRASLAAVLTKIQAADDALAHAAALAAAKEKKSE
jgi:colicin import membrane protein